MNRDSANWWLTLLANLGVLGGLVFVGLEIQQNTSQLRADASYSITAMVNETNALVIADPVLAELISRGEDDRSALSPVERRRFDAYQFSRLNIAEHVLDLRGEGIENLNFKVVDAIITRFRTRPGLQAFIHEYEDTYVGSDELLQQLIVQ
jgi:hypothetical protein